MGFYVVAHFDLPAAVGHPLLTDASIHHEDAGWTDYGASCFDKEKTIEAVGLAG